MSFVERARGMKEVGFSLLACSARYFYDEQPILLSYLFDFMSIIRPSITVHYKIVGSLLYLHYQTVQ